MHNAINGASVDYMANTLGKFKNSLIEELKKFDYKLDLCLKMGVDQIVHLVSMVRGILTDVLYL